MFKVQIFRKPDSVVLGGAQESTGIPAAVRQQATLERTLYEDRTCSQGGERERPPLFKGGWLQYTRVSPPAPMH